MTPVSVSFINQPVGDNQKRLLAALSNCAKRDAQIIILTGGLGPTRGDITAQTVADFLGRPLVLSEEWLKKMEAYFALSRTCHEPQ